MRVIHLTPCRLCSQDHNHKFTLQYCVWDHYKQLSTMDLRLSANLARFLASVIASFALSLSLLKVKIRFATVRDGQMMLNVYVPAGDVLFPALKAEFMHDVIASFALSLSLPKVCVVLQVCNHYRRR